MALLWGLAGAVVFLLALEGWTSMRAQGIESVGLAVFDHGRTRRERSSLVGKLLVFLDRVVGGRVLGQVSPEMRRRLRTQIAKAGRSDLTSPEGLVRRQASFAFLGLVGALVLLSAGTVLGFVLVPLGWWWPRFQLWLVGRRRADQIEKQLPDFLDVLTVTISAGLGFRAALKRVAERVEGAVSDEMLIAIRQIEVGVSRRDAFREMRDRSSSASLNNFLTAFLQAEELGTPITGFLETFSKELRRASGQRARTAAARANPKISMILTLIIMPALCIFMIGSIVLVAVLD